MSVKMVVRSAHCLLAACVLVALSVPALAEDTAPAKAGIEGMWMLTSRDLPDGTTQTPPAVQGLLSYRGGHRNFNVYWTDAEGSPRSISMISTYTLGDGEYSETCSFVLANDGTGAGPAYQMTAVSATAPVTKDGKTLTIDMPLFNEPVVVFDGDKMTATREGQFVDHWVRVK